MLVVLGLLTLDVFVCLCSSFAAGERLVRPPSVEERDQDGGRFVRRGGRVQPGHRALGGDSGFGQARPGL